ncbi:MAG: acetyl-coenzyme A carboxylase carboxyl transferase subunit alpha [Alphaproteobacteria bacterium]|nr:MAG: acetyl-coenzyme A carboxylase carboxyl transferase subunit alpha [Alphaproteobacteria bacterium]
MKFFLDFESEIAELEARINELRHVSNVKGTKILDEISNLEFKTKKLLKAKYSSLSPWQRVQVARHPERPHFIDYISGIFENFQELNGDRNFGQDDAIIGGLASLDGQSVMIIGQEKGNDTNSRIKRNFGMARPEGYRKSIRLMNLANKFNLPILTFVDTAGAYPGVGAEQRGQSEAIASSIKTCLSVDVPLISIIIGEGGSGGAVAIATGDRVLMLENSVYSVISPEGCASILWQKEGYDEIAANSLKLTSSDLVKLNVIDEVISEPLGGAHRDIDKTIENVKQSLVKNLKELNSSKNTSLLSLRRKKYLKYGSTLRV